MTDPTSDAVAGRDRTELRLLHTLLNQLPALVAYWDAECRNVVANHAYVEYFGLGAEQIRGMHISELLGDELYARNLPFITGRLRARNNSSTAPSSTSTVAPTTPRPPTFRTSPTARCAGSSSWSPT